MFLSYYCDKTITAFYPVLDSVISLLAGEKLTISNGGKGLSIAHILMVVGLPQECRSTSRQNMEDNKSPSYESLFSQ
jgi:hypothetical protein